jgi:hypothetical protein
MALWSWQMAGIGRRGICSYSAMHYLYWIAGTYALNPPLIVTKCIFNNMDFY